jgi:sodium/potassium-transporting ATPase subunit alpha
MSGKDSCQNIKKKASYDFHKLSLQELCERLETSPSQGLSQEKAKALLAKNGKNQLKKPSTHICQKLIKYCFSGFCWLLWIGSIVLFLSWKPLGDPPDATNLGLAILLIFVIALQAVFEAFQDWTSGKVMKSIKSMMPSDATVVRDGVELQVPVCDLVVGDVVVLTNGSKVPADLRLIESNDLKFDRSMITGRHWVTGFETCD